ncbi:MAG TPA: thiolase family protein [Candidatus Dormibacteraeota bacterium]|nr:thiolase family protein [Candidatus Dormibacteraeota bacterium]
MTETGGVGLVVEPKREWSRQVAIVGVGETDFGADYKAARAQAPGYEAPDAASLALRAFERALTDAGLQREDVDGLSVSLIYGGAEPAEMAQVLGITPRFITRGGGIMAGTIPAAVAALMSGQCDTIALVYAAASRAIGRRFGGATYTNAGPVSYYYYHPWGWSSQAAHWALIFRYYMNTHGATEADLGAVAMTLRRHASINDNAIMRTPLSIEDYLGSRYIVSPLHLFDMCLVNDGGLCIILRRRDMAEALRHTPVLVAGWGHAEIHRRKLHHLVRERLRPQFAEAGEQAFAMAGLGRDDMQHFQGYDASSIHLVQQLEGYGFAGTGEGLEFFKAGHASLGGRLPVNTSGGLLSEAYMHGWNHIVEATRQLRHEAAGHQIEGIETSFFSMATTQEVDPVILVRGA